MQSLREGISGALKILDKEVLELGKAHFNTKDKTTTTDKKTCMKLLNHFRNNPNELLLKEGVAIYMHIKLWKFFNEGDNCSDYVEIYSDRLEISCQDWYDEDKRLEFHENIERLLGSDYIVTVDDNLVSLHICVTERCLANCRTCYVNKGLQRDIEKEDWGNLPLAEQYAIGGGEPSEYPLISELIDFIKEKRKGYVAITTNGQKIINFKKHLPDKIAVSIDGLTQKEHEITHNTDLGTAFSAIELYRSKGINICINHILHRENIDNAKDFVDFCSAQGYDVNLILFVGEDNLKPTFEQLCKFGKYFGEINDKKVMIDSCLAGLLNMLDGLNNQCQQGLYSKYYKFGAINPCSHSSVTYPNCSVMEDYMKYFFRTLRPIVFVYSKDGTSGAHEWAFKIGYQGKIRHKIDRPLRKDTVYILTYDEVQTIIESHYLVSFENKMPYWIRYRNGRSSKWVL